VIGWGRGWGTVYICVADCTSKSGRGGSANPVAAAASESSNCRGAAVKNVAAAAPASTSGRGAGLKNGGAAAFAAPADQFLYHVVVHSDANLLLIAWFYRHKHSFSNQCDRYDSKS